LVEFWEKPKYRRAKKPLTKWYAVAEKARWYKFADVRQTDASADSVKTKQSKVVVFNVGGNKYRIITAIHYNNAKVYILRVLDHKEYDKGHWKEEL